MRGTEEAASIHGGILMMEESGWVGLRVEGEGEGLWVEGEGEGNR